MGVDCKITLPAKARIHDVADVIGALLGNEMEKVDTQGGYYVRAKNTKTETGGVVSCASIITRDTSGQRWFLYHFEFGNQGERGIMPRSTPQNIAMCKALADFFGGSVDYNDCDDSECDYQIDEQPDIHAEDGDAWYRLQERKLAVKPLTAAQIDACFLPAAYKRVA